MSGHSYKKYMKKDVQAGNPLIKIFILSFFGMLLITTFLIKSFAPTVDTSIGDYKEQSSDIDMESKKIVDNRLEMIQNEDQGRTFSDLMAKADDIQKDSVSSESNEIVVDSKKAETQAKTSEQEAAKKQSPLQSTQAQQDVVYKVYVGSYTSAEQAKVAKDIIQESGNGLNPIVKCIGSNNYTLQVGIFKNKQSAETMLYMVQQNRLPGRIVQDY